MTQLIEESVVNEPPEEWSCSGCNLGHTDEPAATLSRGPICEDCLAICPDCDRPFNLRSGYNHADIGDGSVCNRCTRENYFTCNDCDSWEYDSNGQQDNYGNAICQSCYEMNYGDCDECGNYVNFDRGHDCYPSYPANVLSYSDKPTPLFRHTQEEFDSARIITNESPNSVRKYRQLAYLGFELEVEMPDRDREAFNKGAQLFEDCEEIYLKQDGSINYGFEIVSHPMTLDWAMANFDWNLLKMLEGIGFSAWEESSVGIHVHVSRDGFASDMHQVKFLHFIMRNEKFLSWLAGRGSCSYSRFDRSHIRGLTKSRLKGQQSTERYMAVNLNNYATIEVRMFQSSLKPERVMMNLQLIDAIVKYTENLATSDILHNDGFSHDSFMNFVQRYLTRYPNLSEYIAKWHEALAYEQEHGYKARIGE